MPTGIDQVIPFAELVVAGTAARLWTGQLTTLDPFQLFSYLAGAGVRVPGGTAVTLMPLRDPFEAALQVRTAATTTGETFVAGFAPGSPQAQAAIMGRRYASPLTAAKEYLQAVRTLLAGDGSLPEGRYFTASIRQPIGGDAHVDLALGVLRPRMARIAGEVADAAITWLAPPRYIAESIVPALRAGADDVGRTAPRIVATVHVALEVDRATAADLARLCCGGHLRARHYTTMLNLAGVPVDASSPRRGGEALVDHQVFLHGGVDDVAACIIEYVDAGVDEVIINMTGKNMVQTDSDTVSDLKRLLQLLNVRAGHQ